MASNRNNFDQNKQPGLSRRSFLRAGGLVIIASGAGGILVACRRDFHDFHYLGGHYHRGSQPNHACRDYQSGH
jgi:hypothetical protein